MRRLLLTGLFLTTACASSGLPPVEFTAVPKRIADQARYGVVTLREVNVDMLPPVVGKNPEPAKLKVSELTRAVVTADAPVSLYERSVADWAGCTVTQAVARRAAQGGDTSTVNALADKNAPRRGVKLVLPKPAPGDAVDFFVEHVCTSGFEQLPPIILGQAMPALESRVIVKADNAFAVRIVVSPGADKIGQTPEPTVLPKTGVRVWSFKEKELPAHEEDAFARDPQQVSPWIQVLVQRVSDKPYADTWDSVAARVRESMKAASPAGTPDADLVATGSAQVRFRKLRDKLAPKSGRLPYAAPRDYASIPTHEATAFETAAAIVDASHDAADRGYLALATLAEGPLLLDDVPSLYPFRAALVATKNGANWQFDDPACPNCAPGRVPSDLAGGRAFIVTDDGYAITEIPIGATETSRTRFQFGWALSGDELAASVLADIEGGGARRVAEVVDGGGSLEALKAALFGPAASFEIVSVDDSSLASASPYELHLHVSTKADTTTSALRIPIHRLAGPWVPWITPVTETRDVVIPGPLRSEVVATLTLPRRGRVAKMADVTVRKSVGEYSLHVEQRDDTVTITRRIGVFTRQVPRERYTELRELVLAAADADAAVLELDIDK